MDTVLVIDDERNVRGLLTKVLSGDHVEVHSAATGGEGVQLADEVEPDVVLLDLRLPDTGGLDVLRTLRSRHPDTAVIMMTAFGQIENVVEAMRLGASDYLEKPFERLEKLRFSVDRTLQEVKARREIHRLHGIHEKKYGADRLVGDSEAIRKLRDMVGRLAASEARTVLILGESGTGKELVARGLHHGSPRRDLPFVEVNCAAIAEGLVESELFGHEKGAFTDAKTTKKGLVEMADHGTLFLDEVSEMSLGSQAKLLRCLQERAFKRVGGTRDIKVDVRVIASTNRPLEAYIKEGRFREDLYYRLNVIPIAVPSLRERKDDVLPLALHFLAEANAGFHKSIKGFSPETEQRLIAYDWPGNVRELKNLVERLAILATSDRIEAADLPPPFGGSSPRPAATPEAVEPLDVMEKRYIHQVIELLDGNKSRAAKMLGISRQTLRRKLEEA